MTMTKEKLDSVLQSAVESGNVQEKIESATGTYADKVTSASPESKSIYSSLPKGTDPSPFVLGSTGQK